MLASWAQALDENFMIENINKYITIESPEIAWRFLDNIDVIKDVQVLNTEVNNILWNKILESKIIKDFSLNKEKFESIEEILFKNEDDQVTKRFKELQNREDKVILLWAVGQALITKLETFVENWRDFFYPGADDLLIINTSQDWIIYISHFECFQCGKGINDLI